MTDVVLKDIHFPYFVSQVKSAGGLLTDDAACHACWYYYVIAHDAYVKVGKGPESQTLVYDVDKVSADSKEMPLWMDKHYAQQARSVAMLYGLNSPDEMFAFWPVVMKEAMRLGMPNPEFEYMNPKVKDHIT